jgi:hypothetical protein
MLTEAVKPIAQRRATTAPRRFITVKEASYLYSASEDWLRRTKEIPKVYLGRRMVRIDAKALEAFFRQHEV